MSASERRSAVFLDEMGLGPVWTMRASAPAAEPGAGPSASAPEPGAVSDLQIAAMDWDELQQAVAICKRCTLCASGRTPVFGSGARTARWLVAAGACSASDEQLGDSVSGEPGKLLANMLAAVGMSRQSNVWVSNLIKCRPTSPGGGERAPSAQEAAACRPYLERELALCGATTVVTLGQIAANGLLGKALQSPLAGARGVVHSLALQAGERTLVATLHPGELLRRGADKALAWADLCLARAADERTDPA